MKKDRKQILIIGLGKFGMSIAKTLDEYDCDVMAIDTSSELVDKVQGFVTHSAKVDAADIDTLRELGVSNFDIAIIGVGEDLGTSLMIALTLKELKVPYIIAKSRDDAHTKLLNMIGVDKVVQPERDIGIRVAKSLMHENVIEQMEIGNENSIVQIEAPREWIDSRINELNIRPKYNVNILCIEKQDKKIIMPQANYKIEEGDKIMMIAPNSELGAEGFLAKL